MRGSKYVEAELNYIFKAVKKDLLAGKTVLFVGTPCHIAALKAYLVDVKKENLYTVDLLCSSVCSPILIKKYIKFLEAVYKKTVTDFCFRDQTRFGWRMPEESFVVGDKKIYLRWYSSLYYSRKFSRPSCDECQYRNLSREGDVSLGDAWGSKDRDSKGLSLILCNTEKGKLFFDEVKEKGFIGKKVDVNDYLQAGFVEHKYVVERKRAWRRLSKYGFIYVLLIDIGIEKFNTWCKKLIAGN